MGLYAGFDVVSDFGFLDVTETWGIVPDYSAGCDVFVSTFISVAQGMVPVDTGYLQSTIDASTDGTFCECEATAEYAQYVEYGTWKMGAQPYFAPALDAALAAAEPLWSAAEEQAIKEDEMLTEEEEMEQEMQREQMQNNGISGGGVNFSSFGAFVGSIIIAFVVALVTTTIQAMLGKDFSSHGHSSNHRNGGGEGGMVFTPDIIIT